MPPLDSLPEEERARIEQRNERVLQFRRLALLIAGRLWNAYPHIRRRTGSFPDLAQEAFLALVHLADLYQEGKGAKPITYFQTWGFLQTMRGALENGWFVSVPPAAITKYRRLKPATRAAVDQAMNARTDTEAGCDRLCAHDPIAIIDNDDEVAGLLAQLEEREAWVLRQRFGLSGCLPRTLEDIGTELGITKEWVRQIQYRALKKLRKLAAR
jgi:RNA polymerase sigma factor (sigma-70 family)